MFLLKLLNMDHLLFNERNSLPIDKGRNAFIFASKCKDITYLHNSIYADDIRSIGTFAESWNMIQESYNSLARHSNMNILLDVINKELQTSEQ